jgi:alkanesulfonate monooxygenase SsuD/methylene tetrahydromethanopterin reductase-like flavin-dependent oxidoreductase (luciferase family)
MIRPWIFEFFATHDGEQQFSVPGAKAAFDWRLDLWSRAEEIGFEGIFFSEHHFAPGRLSPSPNLLIAAVAQRTTRLRLGVMGMVLPLYAPWRAAEEAGMLDYLSGGRLEIGVSSGAGPMETRQAGIAPEDVRPMFEEALDILEAGLTQASFSHQGRFWSFKDLQIVPRPLQQPLPRRWMTCVSEATAAMAAARGYAICTGFVTNAEAEALFEAHAAAAGAAGHPRGPDRCALRRQIVVADSDAEGKAIAQEATGKLLGMFARAGRPDAHAGPTPSAAPDAPPTPRGLFFGEDETIVGSPASVAEQIIQQCRATGAGHMLAYPFITATRDQVARSYELWRQVVPILRRA